MSPGTSKGVEGTRLGSFAGKCMMACTFRAGKNEVCLGQMHLQIGRRETAGVCTVAVEATDCPGPFVLVPTEARAGEARAGCSRWGPGPGLGRRRWNFLQERAWL